MQTTSKRPVASVSLLLAICLSLFSFTAPKGGDSFEIWLNNKLVVQQFIHADKSVKNLVLREANYNDKLTINYSHCGKIGKARSISLKDAQNKVVKTWTFADANSKASTMTCTVKEIMDLQKTKGNVSLRLIYTSTELPAGHVLVSISSTNNSVAAR